MDYPYTCCPAIVVLLCGIRTKHANILYITCRMICHPVFTYSTALQWLMFKFYTSYISITSNLMPFINSKRNLSKSIVSRLRKTTEASQHNAIALTAPSSINCYCKMQIILLSVHIESQSENLSGAQATQVNSNCVSFFRLHTIVVKWLLSNAHSVCVCAFVWTYMCREIVYVHNNNIFINIAVCTVYSQPLQSTYSPPRRWCFYVRSFALANIDDCY